MSGDLVSSTSPCARLVARTYIYSPDVLTCRMESSVVYLHAVMCQHTSSWPEAINRLEYLAVMHRYRLYCCMHHRTGLIPRLLDLQCIRDAWE